MPISFLSVMPLLIEMRFNDTLLSTGTAFLAATGNNRGIVTNRHNVTGRNNDTGECLSATAGVPNHLIIWHNKKSQAGGWDQGQWVPVRHELFRGDEPLWIEHPTLGAGADFVALPLDPALEIVGIEVDVAPPQKEFLVGPGEVVSVIGFPFGRSAGGRYGIWATGFMASEPDVDQEELPMFYVDCRSRKGQSGSPVFAHRSGGMVPLRNGTKIVANENIWNFLGVYSGRISQESDIGRVWKRTAIEQLVASMP